MGLVDGKIAIVSGAGSGMGAAHVRALAEQGARVVGFDVTEGEARRMAVDLGGDRFHFLAGDVRSAADWTGVVTDCRTRFGAVSVLVNNAGILRSNRAETASEAEYREVVDVNQVRTFLGMQSVIATMRESGGGSIINICSTAGLVAFPDNFAYIASKWAVRGMTRAAALELAAAGIRVNAICPGETDTPMIRDSAEPGTALPAEALAFRRWARPEEISSAVVFLASDGSSFLVHVGKRYRDRRRLYGGVTPIRPAAQPR